MDRWIKAGCLASIEAQRRIDEALAKRKATRAARREAEAKRLQAILAELDGPPAQIEEVVACPG